MKTTNVILRLCTTLCVIAAFAAFGAGCGDDSNNGSGDDCPSGQVMASVSNGPEQCYESCEVGTDCSEAGASCNSGVCIGGGTSNGADAGNDDTGGGGGDTGLQCGSDEVAANPFGQGETCYATCTDESTCVDAEECLELNDGTMACIEIPTGDSSCAELSECSGSCAQDDAACQNDCFVNATSEAQDASNTMNSCISDNCGDATTQEEVVACADENCSTEINACIACESGDVDLTRGFGFACTTVCTEGGGECTGDETCQSPILGDPTSMFCAHDMSKLADACAGNPDCPTPDVPGGQPFCVAESQDASLVGGFCYAAGCQFGANGQGYGLNSGCGLEAICIEQADGNGGTVGICVPLCSEVEDCRDTDLESYTCSIIQKSGETSVGTCGTACTDATDCEGPEGNAGGRCNATSYCEFPCAGDGSCAEAGGACDGEDFCVFEAAP
jgi:hypothetical protein